VSYQDNTPFPAYGSVKAVSQGAKWTFSSLTMDMVDGTSLNPAPAAIPPGTCALTPEGYAITVPSSPQAGIYPITAAVGPSGYFVLDLGQGRTLVSASYGEFALAGMVQPSSQLDTTSIVAGKYLGFVFVPLANFLSWFGSTVNLGATTAPVAFGQVAASGTVMTGGGYANDDVAQTPAADISLDLGQQDPQNNGLYKSVTVIIADPTGSCVSRPYGGTDAQGNPTCIFPGVAVVGNPENKYAIFVTVDDKRAQTFTVSPTALEFFLYQQ
jgi:hypothetical protein